MIKIAHRGYVTDESQENSVFAISRAINLGYDLVEIDIRETKDQRIVLSHDQDLNRLFGIDKKVNQLSLERINTKTEGKILTLKECFKLCKNKIGLLIEVKDKNYSSVFLKNIYQQIKDYDLTNQVLIYPPRKDLINFYFAKLKVGISSEELKELKEEENLAGKVFVLGMPDMWTEEKINRLHSKDLMCLTTVKKTYFARNFSKKNHFKLAEETIQSLKSMGIDALNIDSCYHKFLFDY